MAAGSGGGVVLPGQLWEAGPGSRRAFPVRQDSSSRLVARQLWRAGWDGWILQVEMKLKRQVEARGPGKGAGGFIGEE